MIYQGPEQFPVRDVVVHCTDTAPDFMLGHTAADKVAEVRRWHVTPKPKGRGWRDIGYHWLIDRNGTIVAGRAETTIGAGVLGFNNGVIHISLFGGHGSNEKDAFEKHFTPEQDNALRRLLERIGRRTEVARITGHNEHAAKACPGFNVGKWLKGAK